MNPRGTRGFVAQARAGGALGELGPLEDAPRFADVAPRQRSRKPARQGEGALSDAIRAALAHEPGLLLFRNSQAAMRKGSRVYRGGLGNGSADLVGVLSLDVALVTNGGHMQSRMMLGRFVALEVKRPGEQATEEQAAWLASVRTRGGFASVVCSVDEARAAIVRARTGALQ